MSYYIYKLKFNTGIHFGSTEGSMGLDKSLISMQSDTLYSSLVSEIANIYGDDKLVSYINLTKKNEFLVSDLLPFIDGELFIPKPYLFFDREKDQNIFEESSNDKKQIKKINFIPIEKFSIYIKYLKKGGIFPLENYNFGAFSFQMKNKLEVKKDTQLFGIETFKLAENAGLYFLLKCPKKHILEVENALESLGLTGIGGKKSAGYGNFEFYSDPIELFFDDDFEVESPSDLLLKKALKKESDYYLLLSNYLPTVEEIEKLLKKDSFFALSKRSGFITINSYSKTPQKRKQLHMISSGSLLNFKPEGKLVDLKLHGNHSIYRSGKPLFIGVDVYDKY
jgi:CRISPR-associated protein Csm4